MSIIDNVIKYIEENRTKKHNCVPFTDILPRFSNYIPGVKKGLYYCVTGVPSSAKTQVTDFLFLYHTYDFIKQSDLDVEIVYFSFEINKEQKIINGISKRLFEKYGLRISPNILQSIGSTSLSDDVLAKVKDVRDYFTDLERYVTFYDEPLTPSQIYKIMDERVKANGKFVIEEFEHIDDDGKVTIKKDIKYKPNNPDKYLLFIIDHIGLVTPEPGQNLHKTLATLSANNIYFKNKFGVSIVNVHQQALEGSIEQFTNKGESVVGKLEPQMSLLGDNRTLSRDYDIILGMFSPYKYEVEFYRGYKTKRFEDRCRFLSVLKNREGIPDVRIGLYFDGAVNYFEELPKPDAFSIIKAGAKSDNELLYEKYAKGHVGILDPNKQSAFSFL